MTKPSLELLFRLAKSLDYHVADISSLSDESHFRNPEQLALNTVFISLLADDQELLLEFAKLLTSRASKGPTDLVKIATSASGEGRSTGLAYMQKLNHKAKPDH